MKALSSIAAPMFRSTASLLSRRGGDSRLLILIFHRVLAEPDPLNANEPDAGSFASQVDLVRQLFNVMPLREARARMLAGSLPARSLCITFDDGYRNNREVAAPILASRGLSATFFVATGYLNGGRMWNDTVTEAIRLSPQELDLERLGLGRHYLGDVAARAKLVGGLLGRLKYMEPAERQRTADHIAEIVGAELPRDLMMTDAHVAEMAGMGMEIGAHSVSHPILAKLDADESRFEINESKHVLESVLGHTVTSFAYPNGQPGKDYRAEHPAMIHEAGYSVAVSTSWGCGLQTTDPYQMPRVNPWDRTPERYALRLLRVYLEPEAAVL